MIRYDKLPENFIDNLMMEMFEEGEVFYVIFNQDDSQRVGYWMYGWLARVANQPYILCKILTI